MSAEQDFYLEDVYPGGPKTRIPVLPPPRIVPRNKLFAEAMLEDSSTHHRRSPREWAISIFIHFAILLTLLIVPLYFTQGIDVKRMETTLLVAPLPPMAPPPPPPAALARVAHTMPKVFTPGKLTAPTFIPKTVAVAPADSFPPEESFAGSMGGVPGGVPGGQLGGIVGGMTGVAAPVAAAPMPLADRSKGPVRVGGAVKPPRLISGPAPVYPILARQAQVHGTVVIEAIIDEHGNVVQERVISGHPLLIEAALKAVSQRKYEPTILDGEPTPVDLRVEVSFQM